jgi:hypothetical protein
MLTRIMKASVEDKGGRRQDGGCGKMLAWFETIALLAGFIASVLTIIDFAVKYRTTIAVVGFTAAALGNALLNALNLLFMAFVSLVWIFSGIFALYAVVFDPSGIGAEDIEQVGRPFAAVVAVALLMLGTWVFAGLLRAFSKG